MTPIARAVSQYLGSKRLLFLVTVIACSMWSIARSEVVDVANHRTIATAAAANSELLTRWTAIMCADPSERGPLETQLRHDFMGLEVGAHLPEQLYLEPAQIFDNLYFLGTKLVDAFAITTKSGIILIDSLNSGEEIVAALKKVGLNPADVKYVLMTQGYPDHYGGAKYLQDTFHARIVISKEDWDFIPLSSKRDPVRIHAELAPRKDILAGDTFNFGGEHIYIIPTPGHTPGTVSFLIPVRDKGVPHVAVLLAGLYSTEPYGSADFVREINLILESRRKLEAMMAKSSPDTLLSNHPMAWDAARLVARRRDNPDGKNPLIVGNDFVKRYLTVFDECAKADLARIDVTPKPAAAP